jgi:NhaA family Na+:H+ antiporter
MRASGRVKLGLADLPAGLSWKHIYGASWLAGAGFTVSLFIAGLAFHW